MAIVGRRDGHGYELRVSDNGMGMSEADARHVFTTFVMRWPPG